MCIFRLLLNREIIHKHHNRYQLGKHFYQERNIVEGIHKLMTNGDAKKWDWDKLIDLKTYVLEKKRNLAVI